MMDLQLQPLPELTTRAIRKWYVVYCKDAHPKYGLNRVEKLSYRKFKDLAVFHGARHQELFQLYEHFPELDKLPPEIREQALHLEGEISRIEHLLCL